MCRYAFSGPYRQHYACFHCRKMFRPTMEVNAEKAGTVFPCPQCKRPMCNMGRDFKAPKQHDIPQWRKVEMLYRHGYRYESCGCGPGRRPKTLGEVKPFLAAEQARERDNNIRRAEAAKEKAADAKRQERRARRKPKVVWSFYRLPAQE